MGDVSSYFSLLTFTFQALSASQLDRKRLRRVK